MILNKRTIIAGATSMVGALAVLTAPAMAASAFSDHLWQFTSDATNVVDFNQGSSRIVNDSQLYISTDDWLVLQAGQKVIISNGLTVAGAAQLGSLSTVGNASIAGTGTVGGALTVSSGGATITAGGLTVNGGTATLGATTPVHIASAQTTAPTCASTITGATTCAVTNGTDTRGTITTVGTPSAVGVVTVTYNAAYATAPVVVFSPANASGQAALAYVSATAVGSFALTTTAATPGATPSWNYHVIQ